MIISLIIKSAQHHEKTSHDTQYYIEITSIQGLPTQSIIII